MKRINNIISSSDASSSAVSKASGVERQLPEVSVSSCEQITPEMITAGIDALMESDIGYESNSKIVSRIYAAMKKVQPI